MFALIINLQVRQPRIQIERNDITIRIYEIDRNTSDKNKTLVLYGVEAMRLQTCNDPLEDYFKRITGGEGIA